MADKTALDDVPFPLALIDAKSVLVSCNQAFRDLLGIASEGPEPVALSSVLELVTGQASDQGRLEDCVQAAIEHRSPCTLEARLRSDDIGLLGIALTPHASGTKCMVQITPVPFAAIDPLASPAPQADDQLAAASKQTIDFLSGLNHHLRTPVNGVLGIADLLAETELSRQQATYIEILSRSCNALMHLVDEIQAITLLEQGIMQLERKSIDINDVAQRTLDQFAATAGQKGITSKVVFDPPISDRLKLDGRKLEQVLFILLDNAFRYTDQGSVYLKLAFDNTSENPFLKITVKDTGIGIAKERLPSLFASQNRAETSSGASYGHTGLGLILCHKLVELMGGTIEVDSQFGHGTTFTLQVPTSVAVAGHDEDAEETDEELRGKSAYQPMTSAIDNPDARFWSVLIAEDNPVNQMLFRTVLERLGHKVTVVDNGQAAVAKVQMGVPYDIILMDISMPVMDGLDATAMIRSLHGDVGKTPILALTAHAMEGDREKFINAGMDGYQSKPVDPMALQKAIADVIDNHSAYASIDESLDTDRVKAQEQSERPESGLESLRRFRE